MDNARPPSELVVYIDYSLAHSVTYFGWKRNNFRNILETDSLFESN